MKKTVILVILILCLGGAIVWLVKGQTSSDTKADQQATLAQEEGKQESGGQEGGTQEIGRQESDGQEIDTQVENNQEADGQKADKQEAGGQDANEPISYGNADTDQMMLHQSIGKIEYPLKDLRFDVNKKYRIVLKDNTTGKVVKEYTDQGEFFKANKKEFSVMVSTGKSEKSPYLLSIYEGKECIKEIAYMALGNDIIKDNWVTIDG